MEELNLNCDVRKVVHFLDEKICISSRTRLSVNSFACKFVLYNFRYNTKELIQTSHEFPAGEHDSLILVATVIRSY